MKLFFAKNIAVVLGCLVFGAAVAQPGTTIDLEKQKPEKYKEKLLKSEKTEEKKIGIVKHFMGNTVTHYNYFFNANVKFNEVIERAKESFVDDYTKFLPFYNYTLAATASDKNIDSIIYKCNAGILLHDLRTDWVDDMYMLLGKAYLLRKDFDSAHYVFQYLNFIYAPKDDGYDIPIGSNESNEDGVFTVSTNEKKRAFIQKVLLRKPLERNLAFIWLIRNYLEQRKTGQAFSLISILRNDPYFPKRLQKQLTEMTAYCYYLQQQYDSSAYHLERALGNAEDRGEKSRWEFLCGQMYHLAGMYDEGNIFFEKAIKHSSNPLADVYAHLNIIGQYAAKGKKSKAPIGDIEALKKLAKRERYTNYRDIIYYAAGKISLQLNDPNGAADFFLISATSSVDNPAQKNKSYLALADTKYDLKEYKLACSYYDSVKLNLIDSNDVARVNARKPPLKIISKNIDAIHLQDSLLVLAKLPAKELNAVLKKIYKKYKKASGAKEEENSFDFGSDNLAVTNAPTSFTPSDAKPGEFYFANESVKNQGSKDFKSRWGNRPNVDNWNRAAVAATGKIDTDKKASDEKAKIEKALADKQGKTKRSKPPTDLQDPNAMDLGNPDFADVKNLKSFAIKSDEKEVDQIDEDTTAITPESLFAAIPLTSEKITISNNIIINALFQNGETFSNKLEDYPSAIAAYEELLRRFPKNKHTEQALFNLSYCYKSVNKNDKGLVSQEKLELDFATGDLLKRIKEKSSNPEKDEATKQYVGVYNLFLEGKYAEAKAAKQQADSFYKQKYWSPQLSFIESIYHIKKREDSVAINRLSLIVSGNADKALQEKALMMIDVLKRRKQIEEYLSNLDSNGHYDSALASMNAAAKDSVLAAKLKQEKNRQEVLKTDSSLIGKPFFNNPNEPHYAVLLLDNVDNVFINETVISFNKYNKEKLGNNVLNVRSLKLNAQYHLILIGPLSNAPNGISYIDDVKPQTIKILPWLPTFKFTYSLIGISNLEILKANNNMDTYKVFLKKTFVGKF